MSILNNPKFQPYLIGLVVLLWVVIGIRVYSYLEPEESTDAIVVREMPKIVEEKEIAWEPSYDYSDPFLKKVRNPVVRTAETKTKLKAEPKKEEVKPEPKLSLPITYTGYIANDHTDERLGMFHLGHETFMKKQGEKHGEIKIMEIHERHAVLKEGENTFIISAQ